MLVKKGSREEAFRLVIEEPVLRADVSFREFSITIRIEETRRAIGLTVNGNTAKVLYSNDCQITVGMLEEELKRHSSLLKLAGSLRSKQYAMTKRTVDQEIYNQRIMQSILPQLRPVVRKIYRVIIGIFYQKGYDKVTWAQNLMLAIVKRCIAEINKQKEIYASAQVEGADKQLAELVRVMEALIWTLNNVIQSIENSLQADLRGLKTMGVGDDSDL